MAEQPEPDAVVVPVPVPVPDPDARPDQDWDRAERDETPTERLDRNWGDLLQELRVAQTGVQLLTGLLFTAAFQQRFTELAQYQRIVYLATVALSTVATAALIAPVALHRALFRMHARRSLVAAGAVLAQAGLALLGAAVTGVVTLIFSVVAGRDAGIAAGALTLAVFVLLWLVFPLVQRRRMRRGG